MKSDHFISLGEQSPGGLEALIESACSLKAAQRARTPHPYLAGRTLGMIFQKPSTRTRVSFEVGMYQLGGTALYLSPAEVQMGVREPVCDVARTLARYVDAVMLRVMRHTDLVEFAKYSTVPVVNGLSDYEHPCQGLADMMTIFEHKGKLSGLKLAYVGDGNNVCNALIHASQRLSVKMAVATPRGYEPTISPEQGGYELVREPRVAVEEADVVYTDVWTSMGQEQETLVRLRAFEGYTVTEELLRRARPDVIFMHDLPAHRGEEVDEAVIEGPASVVFDQAENRLHAQKAVLVKLLQG